MNIGIQHILLHLFQKRHHPLLVPPQHPRIQPQTRRRQHLNHILQKEIPNPLLPLPLRPRPQRPLRLHVRHAHEPRLAQQLREPPRRGHVDARLRRRVAAVPAGEGAVGRQAAVVAAERRRPLLALEPGAGLEGGVGGGEEGGPVAHGHAEHARVHEVEAARAEGPGFGGVVDDEGAVRGHVAGLDGREVGAGDMGGCVRRGEVDGPGAGAGADVEDFERGGWRGG